MDVLDNKLQYLILVFFLVMGITAGTFTVSNMTHINKLALLEYISMLLHSVKTQSIDYFSVFIHSFLQDTLIFGAIAMFSLLMIGMPAITAILIFKGFCVGFTVGALSLNIGSGGFLAIIFCTFIPNLVLLPCVCKAGVLGLNNSITVFKNRKIPNTARDRMISSKPHFARMFKVYLFSMIGVFLETLLTPALIKLL